MFISVAVFIVAFAIGWLWLRHVTSSDLWD